MMLVCKSNKVKMNISFAKKTCEKGFHKEQVLARMQIVWSKRVYYQYFFLSSMLCFPDYSHKGCKLP